MSLNDFFAGFSVANGIWVLLWVLRDWIERRERAGRTPINRRRS